MILANKTHSTSYTDRLSSGNFMRTFY